MIQNMEVHVLGVIGAVSPWAADRLAKGWQDAENGEITVAAFSGPGATPDVVEPSHSRSDSANSPADEYRSHGAFAIALSTMVDNCGSRSGRNSIADEGTRRMISRSNS